MISERNLKKWRKEALKTNPKLSPAEIQTHSIYLYEKMMNMNKRIIKMTQELLDQHLLRR